MTKKKTAKKKTIKKVDITATPIEVKAAMKEVCLSCKYFRINGEGAKRGRCHRYPSSTPTEINHFCGEYK